MADKIKKFFARKKLEAKFKLAGPGHKLNESSESFVTPSGGSKKQGYVPAPKRGPSDATRHAGEAALARLTGQRKDNAAFNTSLAAIQAQVRKELEAEKKQQEDSEPRVSREFDQVVSPLLAVGGVYFRCPMISEEVLSKEEWKVRMKEYLLEQLAEEPAITACLMIHSCNYNRNKVNDCVEILCKYLENIVQNPEEPKFHKIRCSNATFRDKVLPIFGATEVLMAAGFTQQTLEHNGTEESFFVFHRESVDSLETLEFILDTLRTPCKVDLELDRNLQVLSPAQASKRIELPPEFYTITPEELKKEQQLRNEAMEQQMMLRTKAMREKEELREIRKYKFALIRVRFPDGVYLQGTFSVYEKLSDVLQFVQDNLENPLNEFTLSSPTGLKLIESDYDSTLFDLRLVPATILTFQWDAEAAHSNTYLKPEVQILIQSM